MMRGWVKGYSQCYKSFVVCSNQSGHKLNVKPSKKHKQSAAQSCKLFIHQLFYTMQASNSFRVSNGKDTDFHQPNLRKLNYTSTGLADECCEPIHVQLAIMQSMLHTYNVSSQLVNCIKDTFIESPNARNIMQVSIVNHSGLPRLSIS